MVEWKKLSVEPVNNWRHKVTMYYFILFSVLKQLLISHKNKFYETRVQRKSKIGVELKNKNLQKNTKANDFKICLLCAKPIEKWM